MEKITGLSRGTISRAFNHSTEIKRETKDFIFKKAEEIGYSPNSGARAHKLSPTQKWGLIYSHFQNPWMNELAEALDYQAQMRNTKLIVGLTHNHDETENKLVKMWMTGEVDALIANSSSRDDNYPAYLQAQNRGVPLVFLFGSPKRAFDCVDIEGYGSFQRTMEYLYDMGHRHIGYVGHQHNESKTTLSYRAYQAFLQDRGLKQREEYSHFGSFETAGPEAWTRWQHLKIRPTAAICTADVIALSLMQEVVATGRRVPQDLSVVGHDDIAAAARMKLTTIRIDPTAFAFAVASLLERPRGDDHPKMDFRLVRSEFILRQSVAKITPTRTARSD
jgi:DNA-binding LacI/PurR family transcriptional regulator